MLVEEGIVEVDSGGKRIQGPPVQVSQPFDQFARKRGPGLDLLLVVKVDLDEDGEVGIDFGQDFFGRGLRRSLCIHVHRLFTFFERAILANYTEKERG